MITALAVTTILDRVMPGQDGWFSDAVYWLAILAFLLVVPPLTIRAARLGAAVAGAAALSFLGWVDPALTAVVAVPLVAGVLADRRAVAARAAGMSAVAAVLDQVSASIARLISSGRGERIRHEHLATVDRFHAVFSAQTRRVSAAVALVEIACSPVTILAVVLTAGTVLMTPGADLLAFLLLGPVVGACLVTSIRHQPPGAPPQCTTGHRVNVRTTIGRLSSAIAPSRQVHKAAIAAISTAVLHGVGLALAVAMVWSLFDPGNLPRLPLFSLPAVAIAHTLALCWSSVSAQGAGTAVLRQLSRRIIDRILTVPQGSLTGYEDQLSRLATRDAVTVSGLPVHALRLFSLAVLMPVAALLTMIMIEWRLTIPVLFLSPLVALAVRLLLTEPCRDLQSARTATNRVLAFLGASHGVSLPGVEK